MSVAVVTMSMLGGGMFLGLGTGSGAARAAAGAAPPVAPTPVGAAGGARSTSGDAAAHPLGDSATVLATISTLNGSLRTGGREYSGGDGVFNVTTEGDRLIAPAEYSASVVLVNTTTGVIVAAPLVGAAPIASAYDPWNGEVYVVDEANATIWILNPADGQVLGTLVAPHRADAIAVDRMHNHLIVLEGAINTARNVNAVVFLDPTTGAVLAERGTGINPTGLALDPWAGLVYVANAGSSNVSVYNTTTFALVATLPTPPAPSPVVYDPRNGDIYVVSSTNGSVSVFNGSTHTPVKTIGPVGSPGSMTYDPRSDEIVVVNYASNALTEISGASNTVVGSLPIAPDFIQQVAYSPGTNRFYVFGYSANNLSGYNATTGVPESHTPFGTGPVAAVLDPANRFLYVINSVSNNVTVVNTVTRRTVASIPILGLASGIAYDNASGKLYVSSYFGTVTVIDPGLERVVGSITVGASPAQILYDAAVNKLFVINDASQNVTVLSGASGGLLATIGLGRMNPLSEALDTANGMLYVAGPAFNGSGNLTPINPASDTTGPSIPIARFPSWVGYDPSSRDLVVGTGFSNTRSTAVLNPTTGATLETLAPLNAYGPVGWDPTTGLLAVPDYYNHVLNLLGGTPGSVVASVSLGESPISTTVDPASGLVYVVNEWGSSISVVSLSAAPDAVVVAASPPGCGPVLLAGAPANGSVSLASGAYSLSAPSCYGYQFQAWSVTGGVSVASGASTTQLTVLGDGTVTARYAATPGIRYAVAVSVAPASCGNAVSLAGSGYANATVADLLAGAYPVTAGLCTGFEFSAWQVTGGLTLVVQGPLGGLLTVGGNGSLKASYAAGPTTTTPPPATTSSNSGYSTTELLAFVAAGALGGALLGVLVGLLLARRPARPPPTGPAPPPSEPPPKAG